MTLDEISKIASIVASAFAVVGVIAALIVYVMNSIAQARQRSVDNSMRYWEAHEKLFKGGSYLPSVVKSMEDGNYKRDVNDKELELKFNRLLGTFEHFALLQNAGGVPKSINAYMLGWFCKHIYPELTDKEKANKYWELAIDFIEETMKDAEKLDKCSKSERLEYLKKNHFK